MNMNKFSSRIVELRVENGLTQENFAKEINVSQSTVAKWESGSREPSFDMLILLAKHFKVSTDYLLGLED